MIPENIKKLMQQLLDADFSAYIIGGAVRDYLLGIKPKDYDIFTNATGKEILSIFPNGKILGGKERQEKILTVIVEDTEISSYRSNGTRTKISTSLKEHCSTCDFTINSICMDINENTIDFFKGEPDLILGRIKTVGNAEDRFKEDPLRIMRAFRFANKYDLDIEPHTYSVLTKHIYTLSTLPKERIKEEFLKILPHGIQWVPNDFWHLVCPKFLIGYDYDGGKYHKEPVTNHMINTYYEMLKLTDNPLLLLVALLHDIGKTMTRGTDEEGNNTFHKHEIEGYKFIKDWMSTYKFSTKEINYVSNLIRYHMYNTSMSKGAYLKLFAKLDDNNIPVEHLLFLRYADSQGNLAKDRYKFAEKSNSIVKKYYELKYSNEPFKVSDLEINGHDILKYGFKGKIVGTILNNIFNLIQEGELKNERLELMTYLKKEVGDKINEQK